MRRAPEHALEARWITAADRAAAKAPEAERPETQHEKLAFAGEHAIRLAHDGVGIGFEFQGVRQDHRVDGAIGDRQLRKPRADVGVGDLPGH